MISCQSDNPRSAASNHRHDDAYALTGTAGYNTLPPFVLRKIRHEIVCSSDLETENLMDVFTFKVDLIAQFRAQILGEDQRCLFDDVVDF